MAVAEDKLNTLAIVTIGIASVLLVWASIVALQAYYENSFGAEMRRKATDGKGSELRSLLAEQRASLRELRRNDDNTVRIPVERAKQLVIAELRAGEPVSLVPAVGAHDEPTVPATWGRPADDAMVDEPDAPAADDREDAADDGEDAPAESAVGTEVQGVGERSSPRLVPRAIDPPQDDAPATGEEGDDGDEQAQPEGDGD